MMKGPSGFPIPPPTITPRPAVLGMTNVCVMYDSEVDRLAERGGDIALPSGELRSLVVMILNKCTMVCQFLTLATLQLLSKLLQLLLGSTLKA